MPSVWESVVSAVVHGWSLSSDNIYCGKHLGLGHELLEMPVKITRQHEALSQPWYSLHVSMYGVAVSVRNI